MGATAEETQMTDNQLKKLATDAAEIAMRAAARVTENAYRAGTLNLDDLVAALRVEVKATLPEAIKDAQEAFDCGMREAGLATFTASLQLAGIRAGKAVI